MTGEQRATIEQLKEQIAAGIAVLSAQFLEPRLRTVRIKGKRVRTFKTESGAEFTHGQLLQGLFVRAEIELSVHDGKRPLFIKCRDCDTPIAVPKRGAIKRKLCEGCLRPPCAGGCGRRVKKYRKTGRCGACARQAMGDSAERMRELGRKGGKATVAKRTPEERRAAAQKANAALTPEQRRAAAVKGAKTTNGAMSAPRKQETGRRGGMASAARRRERKACT